MNRIKNLIAISAFSLLVLGLPAVASAQYRNDDQYGNRRNNNYGNIRGTIQSLKQRARNFEQRSDRVDDRYDRRNDRYDNGRYNNNRYSNLEQLADRFRNATNDLEGAYGRGRNLSNSADEARRVLDIASQIDQELARSRGARNIENQWGQMRNDLRIIAREYNLNYNNRSGGWRNRLPIRLPF